MPRNWEPVLPCSDALQPQCYTRVMHDSSTASILQEYFSKQGDGVACVYLFGSRARGTQKPGSDIDVAVLYVQQPPPGLSGLGLELADDLRAVLHAPVDLVVLNSAAPDLTHRVLRDGILVCERDRAARVHFEVDSRRRYFDLLPYLREHRHSRAGTST